jgi:membrane-bound lytic murein transglycosylase D
MLLNKNTIFVFSLAFMVIACTHSPTNPELGDAENLTSQLIETSTQTADFISPPLNNFDDEDFNDENRLTKKENHQLIWQHIENKLELTELYNHPRVVQQKNKFLNDSDYLATVTRQSEPFIHYVLSEIENRQMPAELAVLPIVESGYFPRARSHAKAEGLWQIMPYTARDLGLKRSAGYDGRHDIQASTSAALDYLAQMYNTFDGDWLLALAAYNAGPQRVKRALKKENVHDKNVYWGLRLPRETREYVPKILALCAIIKDTEISYKLLHPIEDAPYLDSIELTKRISPEKLIQTADVSEAEIKLLNPAIRNLSTPIPVGYHLLVPKRDTELLALAIDNMEEAPQPTWAKHKINRGESLSGIARRYGTSIRALREANDMHSNKIVAGRSLVVPLQQTTQHKVTAKVTPKSTVTIVEASHKSEKPNDRINTPYMYVVAMGDSFWKIANRNNTTVKRLFEINGRSANQPLKSGETILVD